MNNDLISREALKKDLKQYFTDGVLDGVSARLVFNQILHDIDNAPTIKDRSLEIAQKSIELGRKVGQLEGKLERPQGDLISREALKEAFEEIYPLATNEMGGVVNKQIYDIIDNAPTVEYTFEEAFQKTVCENKLYCPARPQGEYVDISKLRLMTVEECAGHTIDYAMGWKACIEWIKKGGAE